MNASNSILRFKHGQTDIYLAKYVFSYSNDTVYGSMQRLKKLAEEHNLMLTGSPSTKLNAAKKRKALVQSHCMNRRQQDLIQVTDVIDINKEVEMAVLPISDLMKYLVERKVFTRKQVLDSALNAFRLKDIIPDQEEAEWDTNISDLELSELLNSMEEAKEPEIQDHELEQLSSWETPEEELSRVKTENEELKKKIKKLEEKLMASEEIALENKRLKIEVLALKSRRGEQIVEANPDQLIENALAGKVVLNRDQVDASLGELNASLTNLQKLVEESIMVE